MSQFQQGSSKSVAVRCAKKEEVLLVQKEESIMICHVRSPYRDNEECLDSILFNHLIGIPIIVGDAFRIFMASTMSLNRIESKDEDIDDDDDDSNSWARCRCIIEGVF